MVLGRNYLDDARAALQSEPAQAITPRERLDRAGLAFWQAYVFQGAEWPSPLRSSAEALLTRLLAQGIMRTTIAQMDDAAIERATRELQRFLDACDRD